MRPRVESGKSLTADGSSFATPGYKVFTGRKLRRTSCRFTQMKRQIGEAREGTSDAFWEREDINIRRLHGFGVEAGRTSWARGAVSKMASAPFSVGQLRHHSGRAKAYPLTRCCRSGFLALWRNWPQPRICLICVICGSKTLSRLRIRIGASQGENRFSGAQRRYPGL
jgi:hypothetical protein